MIKSRICWLGTLKRFDGGSGPVEQQQKSNFFCAEEACYLSKVIGTSVFSVRASPNTVASRA